MGQGRLSPRLLAVAVPEWHYEELAAREEGLVEGKERFSDWEAAKDEIRGSVK